MHNVHDLRAAVEDKPAHCGVHLRLDVPIKQAREVREAERDGRHVEEADELLREVALVRVELRGAELHVQLVRPAVVVVVEAQERFPRRQRRQSPCEGHRRAPGARLAVVFVRFWGDVFVCVE